MSYALLEQFIKMIVEVEKADHSVPNQLRLRPGSSKTPKDIADEKRQENSEFSESSGVGAIAGFVAPLGLGSNHLGVASKRKSKNRQS